MIIGVEVDVRPVQERLRSLKESEESMGRNSARKASDRQELLTKLRVRNLEELIASTKRLAEPF